jgi:glycosylphosphatidylinositol transamidase
LLPPAITILLRRLGATTQALNLLQSFSLLTLGAVLSTWATLNFSLALTVGLLVAPLSFVSPLRTLTLKKFGVSPPATVAAALWATLSPSSVALMALRSDVLFQGKDLRWLLVQIAWGWHVQGVWSILLVWAVWWPAWVIAGVVLFSGFI